jgi:hypothetical protein
MTYYSAGSISIDGTATTDNRWIANACYDSDATGFYVRRIYTNLKAGANKIFPYTLIMQRADGRWESLVTSSSTGTSKARNTGGFLLSNVLLMYANYTIAENSIVNNYNIWSMHSGLIDHRYSFNTANNSTSGTTANKPVYIVGSIGNDGLFYLDTTWWTQTLPTTEDGKLYIYIGDAYDYYRLTFVDTQKIFVYTNGKLRQYIQDSATVTGHTVESDVPSNAVFTDTKNTAGSTDTSSKIYLIGATSQATNPQTYSDNEVYATSGVLTTKSVQIGGGSASLVYNANTKSVDFTFT